jgi:hypothetical protein
MAFIPLADGQLLIGGTDNIGHAKAMSGDATIINTGALTFATVNSNVGSYGSATAIPIVTVNAKGLVTAVSTVAPETAPGNKIYNYYNLI